MTSLLRLMLAALWLTRPAFAAEPLVRATVLVTPAALKPEEVPVSSRLESKWLAVVQIDGELVAVHSRLQLGPPQRISEIHGSGRPLVSPAGELLFAVMDLPRAGTSPFTTAHAGLDLTPVESLREAAGAFVSSQYPQRPPQGVMLEHPGIESSRSYALRARSVRVSTLHDVRGWTLIAFESGGTKQFFTTQLGATVTWAGDMDGDGRLDFLVHTEIQSTLERLFLSGLAGPGKLVREAATFKLHRGC